MHVSTYWGFTLGWSTAYFDSTRAVGCQNREECRVRNDQASPRWESNDHLKSHAQGRHESNWMSGSRNPRYVRASGIHDGCRGGWLQLHGVLARIALRCKHVYKSQYNKFFLSSVILGNFVVNLAVAQEMPAPGSKREKYVNDLDKPIVYVFLLEMLVCMFIWGKHFFHSLWRCFDFIVILVRLLTSPSPSLPPSHTHTQAFSRSLSPSHSMHPFIGILPSSNLCVPCLVLVCLWQRLFHLIRERKMTSTTADSSHPNFPELQHVDFLPFDFQCPFLAYFQCCQPLWSS